MADFLAGTADGYVQASSTNVNAATAYSNARGGSGLTVDTSGNDLYIGQLREGTTTQLREAFIGFDTSSIPDDATITSVSLQLYGTIATGASWTIDVYAYDWSTTVTTADWRTGAQLAALTPLLASFATGAAGVNFVTSAYNSFTENGSNFRNAINKTGTTRIIVVSNKQVVGTAPTGEERVLVASADTANDPKLVITYETALVVQDGSLGHGADGVTLTQVHELVVSAGDHGHSVDNVVLTQVHSLTVADAAHDHAADNAVLEVEDATDLEVQDASHSHAAENVAFTQVHELQVSDGTHDHTVDNIVLTQDHQLTVQDVLHVHTSDSLNLAQTHVLTVQDGSLALTSDTVELDLPVSTTLIVQDGPLAHTAEEITLTTIHILQVQDSMLSLTSDNVHVVVAIPLTVQDSSLSSSVEDIVLTTEGNYAEEDGTLTFTPPFVPFSGRPPKKKIKLGV